MGIGEPLDNFDNVMRFLELVNSPDGMNISMRHISLSTCGLVPKIDELAKKKLQISLAISLHGPNDQVRDKIMPVNKAYPMDELLAACRRYFDATGRRIHFEYAMIDGVNDTEAAAREILRRMKGLPAHFNLIPLNHVEESPLKPSSKAAVAAFQKTLEAGGITAIHDRELHDYPEYTGAYNHSREAAQYYLEKFPSIQLILDLHRDALEQNGKQLRTAATVNGQPSAQLMLVMGTDESGLTHENWEKNLSLGLKLHLQLERQTPGITRPMALRSQRFNQDLLPGALLVEVGAAGNTHTEALLAAEQLAHAIAALAKGTG
jgi:stage II sporulation protein P